MYVLDSWAILAWLQDERPAADRVDELLAESTDEELAMSWMNVGEVFYITARRRSVQAANKVRRIIEDMPLQLTTPTVDLILEAATLKAHYPLAYADAFAAALALDTDATLVTGDREFEPLESGESLAVMWLPR